MHQLSVKEMNALEEMSRRRRSKPKASIYKFILLFTLILVALMLLMGLLSE